jgi:four helix bundle protein
MELVGSGDDLRDRTKQFALRLVRLYRALPSREEARIIGRQLLRSGTSVGANYRAASRSVEGRVRGKARHRSRGS